MRTRRSRRNQDRLYRAISRDMQRAADAELAAESERQHPCGHNCACAAGECPCSSGACEGVEGVRQTAEWWLANTDAGKRISARTSKRKTAVQP
jgi:hypothetical protein